MTDLERIKRLEDIVGCLISWISQSSLAPISHQEAYLLLRRLDDSYYPPFESKEEPK